jgi:hypothetical protein
MSHTVDVLNAYDAETDTMGAPEDLITAGERCLVIVLHYLYPPNPAVINPWTFGAVLADKFAR